MITLVILLTTKLLAHRSHNMSLQILHYTCNTRSQVAHHFDKHPYCIHVIALIDKDIPHRNFLLLFSISFLPSFLYCRIGMYNRTSQTKSLHHSSFDCMSVEHASVDIVLSLL